jgi:hypothetical protein
MLAAMIYGIEDGSRQPGYANLKELYDFGQRHDLLLPLPIGSAVGADVHG